MEKFLNFCIKWNVITLVIIVAVILICAAVLLIDKITAESSKVRKVLYYLVIIIGILLAAVAIFAVVVYKIKTDHKVILLLVTYIIFAIPWCFVIKSFFKRDDDQKNDKS